MIAKKRGKMTQYERLIQGKHVIIFTPFMRYGVLHPLINKCQYGVLHMAKVCFLYGVLHISFFIYRYGVLHEEISY